MLSPCIEWGCWVYWLQAVGGWPEIICWQGFWQRLSQTGKVISLFPPKWAHYLPLYPSFRMMIHLSVRVLCGWFWSSFGGVLNLQPLPCITKKTRVIGYISHPGRASASSLPFVQYLTYSESVFHFTQHNDKMSSISKCSILSAFTI